MVITTDKPLACPHCSSLDVTTTATVLAGKFERLFHECSACRRAFAGSWVDTQAVPDVDVPNAALDAVLEHTSLAA